MYDMGAGGGAAGPSSVWVTPEEFHEEARRKRKRRVVLVVGAVVVGMIGIGMAAWVAYERVGPSSYKTYWVPSPAMEPTYGQGEIIRTRDIDGDDVERGDVVIFDFPQAPTDLSMLVKRVVAVDGDEIAAGPDGTVLVNGEALDEPYLAPDTHTENVATQEVPAGHVFVMGDNRTNSSDSRSFGAIPRDDVIAIVLE